MGGTLRDHWVALRPFLLAFLLTVAWLAWAAGSANAASEDPNPLGAVEQATVSLLQDAGTTPPPALQDSPAQAAAVPFPVSGTAAAVADVADPVPGEASEAVTGVVNRTAPPLTDSLAGTITDAALTDMVAGAVDTVGDTVVSVVDSLAPALPGVQVPTVPVPALPLPTVPVPTVPVPHAPLPELPVHLPEVTVPGRSPVTTVPPSGFDPALAVPAVIGLEATAHAGSQTVQRTAAAPQPARRTVSPLEFLANTQALRALAATVGYVVSAAPTPVNAPEPEPGFRFAALQNQSGSASAGTGSAGAEASADVAAFWNILHDARSGLMPDAALIPAAGPSFDPGSSPD